MGNPKKISYSKLKITLSGIINLTLSTTSYLCYMKQKCTLFILFTLFIHNAFSQLVGIKNIPGDYPSLAIAINTLNTQGVGAGGVTINLNQNETAPAGGYILGSLTLDSGVNKSSLANPVIINGNSNTITAFAGVSSSVDAILRIVGVDGMTLSNMNFSEAAANATTTTQMERGIWACMRNQNDGVKDLVIQNCSVNLNGMADNNGEHGILVSMTLFTNTNANIAGELIIPTLPEGIFENITIKSCTTNNCYNGIRVCGNGATSNEVYVENVSIGGNLSSDGNSVSNFGIAGSGILSNAISTNICGLVKINNNLISSNITGSAGGVSCAISSTLCKGNTQLNNNDFSVDYSSATFNPCYGILFQSDTATGNIEINNNHFHDYTHLGNGLLNFIFCQNSPPGTFVVQNNIIEDISRTNNASTTYGIRTAGIATSQKDISFNTIKNISVTSVNVINATSASIIPIYSQGISPTKIYGNYIENLEISGNANNASFGSNIVGVLSDHDNAVVNIDSNRIYSITSNMYTGVIAGISSTDNGCTVHIKGNNISHLNDPNTGFGFKNFNGIRIFSPNSTFNILNNFISDITTAGGNTDNCVRGISLENSLQAKLHHNTIFLGVSTPVTTPATNFGVSGVTIYPNCASFESINNIIHVNATANGTGIVSAIRCVSAGTSGVYPSNISSTTNNNIYYTPNTTNSYLFAQGVLNGPFINNYNLLNDPNFNAPNSLYKLFAAGKDSVSYTENNLVPNANNTYMPFYNGFTSNGGQSLPLVNTDYLATVRNNPPDIGALEFSPFILTNSSNMDSDIDVNLYPNPSSDNINISITSQMNFEFEITLTDMNGKEVYRRQINKALGNMPLQIDLNPLCSGTYFLGISNQKSKVFSTLIQKR